MFWQQVLQVLGRIWDVSVLAGYKADRGVTHWLSQSGPSSLLQLPQKLFIQDIMPLPWPHSLKGDCLHPQHQVLITHSTAAPTVSIVSPLSARGQIQAELSLVPALANQPVPLPQHPKRMYHPVPHPKNPLCQDCSDKEFWAGGCSLQRGSQALEKGCCGRVISAAGNAISGLVVVLFTLPVVLRCHAGLRQGEVCQVELV